MKGLFCSGRKAKNNEEYRLILKKRQKRMWCLFAVGLLTAALGGFLDRLTEGQMGTRQTAFVLGLGIGLSLGALLAIGKIQRLMRNEGRLKEERLKEVDEREIEVRDQALQASAKVLLAVLYLLMIIGGLFLEELVGICFLLIAIFLVSYGLFQLYYGKKL